MDAFARLRETLSATRQQSTTRSDVSALEARLAADPNDIAAVEKLVDIHVAAGRAPVAVDLLVGAAGRLHAKADLDGALLFFDRAEYLAQADQRVPILEKKIPIHLEAAAYLRAFHLAREVVEYRLSRGEIDLAEAFLEKLPPLGERDAPMRKQLEALIKGARHAKDAQGSWLTSAGLPRFPPREDFSDVLVLLVDDDVMQTRVLVKALEPLGCRVLSASDGVQALDLIARHRPSLVISDLRMPDVDGSQLFDRLQMDPATESVPFVCLTSESDEREIVAALMRGVEDYWIKPVRPVETRVRVHKILRRMRAFPVLSGSLAELGVPDLLQMLEANRRTGLLFVESGRKSGTIAFVDGRPIDAVAGDRWGEAAVFAIVSWTAGRFEFSTRLAERPQRIFSSAQALLLEAMRRFDEERRVLDALPEDLDVRVALNLSATSELDSVPAADLQRLRPLLDGRRTLGDVLAELEGDLDPLTTLADLYASGAVRAYKPTPIG